MATVSIEEDVVYIRDPAKSKEIQDAIKNNQTAFKDIQPKIELTKEQKDFIQRCFYNSKK